MTIGRLAAAVIAATTVLLATAAARDGAEPLARFGDRPAGALEEDDFRIAILSPVNPAEVDGRMTKTAFDLRRAADLPRLKDATLRLADLAEKQKAYEDAHPERYLPFAYDVSSKGRRRALKETLLLLDQMTAGGGAADSARTLHLLELLHAVQNGFRYPVKRDYQLIPDIFPLLMLQLRRHQAVDPGSDAPTVADPPPGSIWRDPGELRSLDLYAGFRRASLPRYQDSLCEYRGPKTSWGAHPGFDVKCGGQKLGFKLGDERYGGPFNTRLFDALGYHTVPIDPMERLKLRYDRRVLVEYNSRKPLTMNAWLLVIPLKTHTITHIEDPFDRIEYAVMKDGSRLDAADLKRSLLRDTAVVEGRPRPETVAANYDEHFEQRIDYLVWQAGAVKQDTDDMEAIGAWDYDQLDHAARREVRALFVLGAWVDLGNLRWENTRLAYVKEAGQWSLVHQLSDVGSGLGRSRTLLDSFNSAVDSMLWEVTQRTGSGIVRFTGFGTNEENEAFSSLTADDARWILRRMAALSETQILAALLATGMTAAEVRLALEKLVSKRRKLILDFGLGGEFSELVARRVDRQLNFDPANPAELAQVSLKTPEGLVVPEIRGWRVRGGRLEREAGAGDTR